MVKNEKKTSFLIQITVFKEIEHYKACFFSENSVYKRNISS